MISEGAFGTKLPHIIGSDAVGVVEKIGSEVKQFKNGDLVATHFVQSWQSGDLKPTDLQSRLGTDVQGVFSEFMVVYQM
jgi:NADPH:quinone reductase-like Zn-dependent oxidoreductase